MSPFPALPRSRLVRCAALLALLPGGAIAQNIPQTLTVDSTSAAALSRRQPRERLDTVRAFPTRKLADGVYAVLGDTGRGSEGRSNAGFVVTRTGVVVIDALASPAQGKTLLRTIRTITPLPVRWLILTHHHPDHTFGAIVFKRAGAKVLAHPDRRTLASEDGDDAMVSAWTGVLGLHEMQGFAFADTPDVPITHDTTVTLGGRTFVIDVPGTAHTPGDLVIWLPDARVLFAGDLLIEDGVAMVVDGSSGGLLAALDRLEALQAARGDAGTRENPCGAARAHSFDALRDARTPRENARRRATRRLNEPGVGVASAGGPRSSRVAQLARAKERRANFRRDGAGVASLRASQLGEE